MINLEQVKLLEKKVAKAVDYVERLTKENVALHQRAAELQAKLDANQKRIDELEVLVLDFKEDQGQIEEGILAALDRLSQFEKAMEKSLKNKPAVKAKGLASAAEAAIEAGNSGDAAVSAAGQTCFEIPRGETDGDAPSAEGIGSDIPDPLYDTTNAETALSSEDDGEAGELDIF